MLEGWAPIISRLALVPSSGGRFEVRVDGELLFSKYRLNRHAEPGEVATLVEERLGPRIPQ